MTATSLLLPESRTPLQDAFQDVMGRVATPVCVVTTMQDGLPHGTTVSAFASLSMHPPMVLVSLDRTSELLDLVRRTGRIGVNVLGADHAEWALSFARKGGPAKFAGVPWRMAGDLPRLPGTGWIAGDVTTLADGGDHVVVMATVTDAQPVDGEPLTYHRRSFGTHRARRVQDV